MAFTSQWWHWFDIIFLWDFCFPLFFLVSKNPEPAKHPWFNSPQLINWDETDICFMDLHGFKHISFILMVIKPFASCFFHVFLSIFACSPCILTIDHSPSSTIMEPSEGHYDDHRWRILCFDLVGPHDQNDGTTNFWLSTIYIYILLTSINSYGTINYGTTMELLVGTNYPLLTTINICQLWSSSFELLWIIITDRYGCWSSSNRD